MVSAALVATLALAAPPAATSQENRLVRVSQIQTLADSRSPADIDTLIKLLNSAAPVYELQAAIGTLREWHKTAVTPVLRRLISHPDKSVGLEAAVTHYRWTRAKKTLKVLQRLRSLGSNLRRAFQTGQERGRPLYDDILAEAFFKKSLAHSLVYTRLDGALGLIEQSEPAGIALGLAALEEALESSDTEVRMAAVKYMSVQYDEPAFGPLLLRAVEDSDSAVRGAARNILSRPR